MLKQLKYILNSFTDEQLEDIDLFVDGTVGIDQIVTEKNSSTGFYTIDLITELAEVKINGFVDKESKGKYE